ncbi:hypothetical protein Acor_54380 [Acrocarpospora corrugata]|uniref:Uncharacterized protein n=1 Tax=Acrocarpospora corrugata TaxID=35763 RepID=A0A5M3W5R0_9ACTN|nr:MFS transporter [Acrocarpospora corrugata]GES03372.1 hypothetical protein Acor_54380 [Acrocarpospora corrugata]
MTLRLARAAAFAVVCAGLGILAHRLGGGVVSERAAACGLAVAFLAALPATARERGTGAITLLLAGVQVVLHLLFWFASTLAPLAVTGEHVHSGLVPGLGMLVTHVWAVVLTALWLARGEAALWAVLRRLIVRVLRLMICRTPVATPPATLRGDSPGPEVLRSALLRHVTSGRAPPAIPLPTG